MKRREKINLICNEIMAQDSPYMNYIKDNIMSGYEDDLLQEVMLILLDKPKKMIQAYDEKWLRYLFVNICSKQFFSSTSPFYKKYRVKSSEIIPEILDNGEDDFELDIKRDMEEKWEMLNTTLDKINFTWYETELMDCYFKRNLTYKKIENELGVDSVSAWITIHKCLNKIKDALPEGVEHTEKKKVK